MASSNESLRLLAEISGKLDYALRAAATGARPGKPSKSTEQFAAPANPAATADALKSFAKIANAKDSQEVVEASLDAVVAATGGDRAFVMLLEEGRKLRFKGGRAIDQDTAATEGAQHSKTIIRKVITTAESVLVPDTSQAAEGDVSASVANMVARSILCVPFRAASDPARVMGVLYLDTRATVKSFAQEDLDIALAITDAAGAALEKIEGGGGGAPATKADKAAAAEAQKLRENMTRLLDVGRAIGTTLVLDDLLVLVCEKILEVTKADRGFIMLLEGGKPVFKIGRAWNKKEGAEKKFYKLNETQFFFSKTIVNRALEGGKSVCIKDTVGGGEDASVSIVQMELQSVMATPLREKNQTLGVIYVDSKASNREFDESDLELFEALAGQAAIALENAILFAQAKDKSRLESEIQIAATMQADMCPKKIPELPGIEVHGTMVPAKEVGGDYYDVVDDPHNPGSTLSLIVGDVSGKGLGSGIVAVMARCFLRSMITAYGVESPRNLLAYLNTILSAELKPGMFMTMLFVVWDPARRVVKYSSAGHENIIVFRAETRKAEAITSGGVALGLSTSTGPTADAEIPLSAGDVLVMYSDGVTEAMNENSDEFTLERLVDSVRRYGPNSARAMCAGLAAELQKHVGKADQSDDITLLVLRVTE